MNLVKILIVGGLFILITLNSLILNKEKEIAKSQEIKVALSPVDPRSLIQGDYMRLRYKVPSQNYIKDINKGKFLITIDDKGFVLDYQLYKDQMIKKNQALLNFRRKKWGNIFIGSESYLFEEGKADYYAKATHAIFYLSPTGSTILKGLYIPPKNPEQIKDNL